MSAGDFTTGSSPFHITLADLNADGHQDAIVAAFNSSTISVLPGVDDGTFGTAVSLSSAGLPIGVVVADFDGDGLLDVVGTDAGPDSLSVFLNPAPPEGRSSSPAG